MRNRTKFFGASLYEGYKSGALVRETAERDGYPERKAIAAVAGGQAGELAYPAQPVTHRVRVHEQQPGGRLQRVALLQVGHHGVEQRGPAPPHRPVHLPPPLRAPPPAPAPRP